MRVKMPLCSVRWLSSCAVLLLALTLGVASDGLPLLYNCPSHEEPTVTLDVGVVKQNGSDRAILQDCGNPTVIAITSPNGQVTNFSVHVINSTISGVDMSTISTFNGFVLVCYGSLLVSSTTGVSSSSSPPVTFITFHRNLALLNRTTFQFESVTVVMDLESTGATDVRFLSTPSPLESTSSSSLRISVLLVMFSNSKVKLTSAGNVTLLYLQGDISGTEVLIDNTVVNCTATRVGGAMFQFEGSAAQDTAQQNTLGLYLMDSSFEVRSIAFSDSFYFVLSNSIHLSSSVMINAQRSQLKLGDALGYNNSVVRMTLAAATVTSALQIEFVQSIIVVPNYGGSVLSVQSAASQVRFVFSSRRSTILCPRSFVTGTLFVIGAVNSQILIFDSHFDSQSPQRLLSQLPSTCFATISLSITASRVSMGTVNSTVSFVSNVAWIDLQQTSGVALPTCVTHVVVQFTNSKISISNFRNELCLLQTSSRASRPQVRLDLRNVSLSVIAFERSNATFSIFDGTATSSSSSGSGSSSNAMVTLEDSSIDIAGLRAASLFVGSGKFVLTSSSITMSVAAIAVVAEGANGTVVLDLNSTVISLSATEQPSSCHVLVHYAFTEAPFGHGGGGTKSMPRTMHGYVFMMSSTVTANCGVNNHDYMPIAGGGVADADGAQRGPGLFSIVGPGDPSLPSDVLSFNCTQCELTTTSGSIISLLEMANVAQFQLLTTAGVLRAPLGVAVVYNFSGALLTSRIVLNETSLAANRSLFTLGGGTALFGSSISTPQVLLLNNRIVLGMDDAVGVVGVIFLSDIDLGIYQAWTTVIQIVGAMITFADTSQGGMVPSMAGAALVVATNVTMRPFINVVLSQTVIRNQQMPHQETATVTHMFSFSGLSSPFSVERMNALDAALIVVTLNNVLYFNTSDGDSLVLAHDEIDSDYMPTAVAWDPQCELKYATSSSGTFSQPVFGPSSGSSMASVLGNTSHVWYLRGCTDAVVPTTLQPTGAPSSAPTTTTTTEAPTTTTTTRTSTTEAPTMAPNTTANVTSSTIAPSSNTTEQNTTNTPSTFAPPNTTASNSWTCLRIWVVSITPPSVLLQSAFQATYVDVVVTWSASVPSLRLQTPVVVSWGEASLLSAATTAHRNDTVIRWHCPRHVDSFSNPVDVTLSLVPEWSSVDETSGQDCVAPLSNVTLRLSASPPVIPALLHDIAGVAAVAGAAAGDAQQSMLQISLSRCEFSDTQELAIAESPTRLRFRPSVGSAFRGAVVGNVALFIGVCAASTLGGIVHHRVQQTPTLLESLAVLGLPGRLYIALSVILQPTVSASVALFLLADASAGDYVLGVFGVVFVMAVAVSFARRLHHIAESLTTRGLLSIDSIVWWGSGWTGCQCSTPMRTVDLMRVWRCACGCWG